MSDYLLPFQPSLAQATNTRLDSACKHIQQCRVSTDDMTRFVIEDNEELQRNKYRYCIHKDELVVGVGRPWCVSLPPFFFVVVGFPFIPFSWFAGTRARS